MKYCFPQHQWLHERASMLRYTYIACVALFTVAVSAIKILNKTNLSLYFTYKSMLRGRLGIFLKRLSAYLRLWLC